MGDRQTDSIPADNKAGRAGGSRQVSRDGLVFPNAHLRTSAMGRPIFYVCGAVYLAVLAAIFFGRFVPFFYTWLILGIVAMSVIYYLAHKRAMTVVVRNGNLYIYKDEAQRIEYYAAPYGAFDELRVDCIQFLETGPSSRASLHLKAEDSRIRGQEVRLILDRATYELPPEDRQAIEAVATEMGLVVNVRRH